MCSVCTLENQQKLFDLSSSGTQARKGINIIYSCGQESELTYYTLMQTCQEASPPFCVIRLCVSEPYKSMRSRNPGERLLRQALQRSVQSRPPKPRGNTSGDWMVGKDTELCSGEELNSSCRLKRLAKGELLVLLPGGIWSWQKDMRAEDFAWRQQRTLF